MLFNPDLKEGAKAPGDKLAVKKRSGVGRRLVAITVWLLILAGLGYVAWMAVQQSGDEAPSSGILAFADSATV